MKFLKFGGSSLADAPRLARSRHYLRECGDQSNAVSVVPAAAAPALLLALVLALVLALGPQRRRGL